MTVVQISLALGIALVLIAIVYHHVGWRNIRDCYAMWFTRKYWTDYNIVEAASWITKAILIIPGLIFQIHICQLYFLSLATSLTLFWASNKKLLPTLVGFNTMWVWLSLMVLVQNLVR